MLRFSDILGHAFLNYCTHPKIDNSIQFTFQKGLFVNLRECISSGQLMMASLTDFKIGQLS
jgi:hypothetical protein